MRKERRLLAAVAVAAVAGMVGSGVALAEKPVEELRAFAVNMSNISAGAGRNSASVDITIDRWTTDAERDKLVDVVKEKGAEGLLDAIRDMDEIGRIQSGGSLGYPLRFAREVPLSGGGRRIIIGTDRRMSFLEVREQPRTVDYPFMVIDIRLKANGKGEGKLMPLAKITTDRDHILEIENYASEPVRLTSVESRVKPKK
jgi:hypothetical protein